MLQLSTRASDVRQHFSEFIDGVVRDRPGFVVRNRDTIIAFNPDHLEVLLSGIEFHAHLQSDENGEIVGTLKEIDLIVCEKNEELALQALAEELVDYATDYLTDQFRLYFNAPNRRGHFPYVIKVATQPSVEHVRGLIHART